MAVCFKVPIYPSLSVICVWGRELVNLPCPGFAYSSSLSVLFMIRVKSEHLHFQTSADRGFAAQDDWPFTQLQRSTFPLIFPWNYRILNGYITGFSFALQTLFWPGCLARCLRFKVTFNWLRCPLIFTEIKTERNSVFLTVFGERREYYNLWLLESWNAAVSPWQLISQMWIW